MAAHFEFPAAELITTEILAVIEAATFVATGNAVLRRQ